jgi:hypothetical protein
MRIKKYFGIVVFLVLMSYVLPTGSTLLPRTQNTIDSIAQPYELDLATWELKNTAPKWQSLLRVFRAAIPGPADQALVDKYFTNAQMETGVEYQLRTLDPKKEADQTRANSLEAELVRLNAAGRQLEPQVEDAIEKQLAAIILQEKLKPPWLPSDRVFPPVNIKLESMPVVLVVSPRDKIRVAYTTVLKAGLHQQEIDLIENRIRAAGYSAIVEPLGGFGTYPAMIPRDSNLDFVLTVSAHEWVHNLLIFAPLGQSYGSSDDMRTMNETTANIVGKELAGELKDRYYRLDAKLAGRVASSAQKEDFDFDMEMRKTRLEVDRLLGRGDIVGAETFMENERIHLAQKGYYIRRLNQAYFAFHQNYADSPLTTNRIGQGLVDLRVECKSLVDFVQTVSAFSSVQDLDRALAARRGQEP